MAGPRVGFCLLVEVLFLSLLGSVNVAAQPAAAPRVVDLTAADGTHLKATYFGASKAGPGVLLRHQCNRQRKVWDDLARDMAASGLHVLTLDFRGLGESEGTLFDKLSPEEIGKVFEQKFPGDVDMAFQYLVAQPGVTRETIGAGGASCGVNQAVQLARRHTEVKSLVLLSEGTDGAGREFLRRSPRLPLFLAVADDDPDPGMVEIMQWLFSLSGNPVTKFEHYPTGGHGVEMFAGHKELPGTIVAWLGSTLRTPRSGMASGATARASHESHFLELIDRPGGVHQGAQVFAEARRRDPQAVLFSEAVMNRLGYQHLQSGDTQGALEILKLNVSAYPHSPNVYDSVSDAYLAYGQKDLARQNAKKALEHLASDTSDSQQRRQGIHANAEEKLKQLGEAPQ